VIINSEKLKKAYAQIFKQLPENYHHSTAHRIAVIPIDNERYKAIVTVSHRSEADDWLLTEEEIFFTKMSSQILTGRSEYITTPSAN